MGGFDDDPMATGSYSELLFADHIPGFDPSPESCLDFTSCFSLSQSHDINSNENPHELLRFGKSSKAETTSQKSDSCPNQEESSKKRVGPCPKLGHRNNKKSKTRHNSSPTRHAKVGKKERLGVKIAVLQQLVSPFGKTDTASVLHEASGYIKFLHEQVQVLCSPYILRLPAMPKLAEEEERRMMDLRSRGLCLVAVDLIRHVATESNGADLYSSTSAAVFAG